jgi:glycosyltransferase involved in cell wall biosynthesis
MGKVSVIVPCYNYANFISQTLNSVRQQTYQDWECIVVDDGSTDNSKDIIFSYTSRDPRFVYVYQENRGLSAARNTGIKEAKGDFLQFLDADDLIESRKLELQVLYLKEHPDVEIVYGDVRYFSTEQPGELLLSLDGKNRPWMPKVSGKGEKVLNYLIRENIMVVSSPLVSRKVIEECGFFDETLKACEDWDYWLRCALAGLFFKYEGMEGSYSLVRMHRASMSKNISRMIAESILIREKLDKRLATVGNKKEIRSLRSYNKLIKQHLLQRLEDRGNTVSGFIPSKMCTIKLLLANSLRKIKQ